MCPEHASAHWVLACRLEDLPPGGRILVTIDTTEVALFNLNGVVYAINNRCPHRGGPLIRGFLDAAGGIKCPLHGWRFDLRDGSSQRPARATTYPVKIQGEYLYVLLTTPALACRRE
ncbi:MAG: Rieske (2Fe-2S) protein [Candidatus Binatia bacterium]|nr:Rieske (2Fe-2S) protein [Candidatus Binatia bacterium]